MEGDFYGGSILILNLESNIVEAWLGWANSGAKGSGPFMFNAGLSFSGQPLIGTKTDISYNQAANFQQYHSIRLTQSQQFANGLLLSGSYSYSASPKPDTDFARDFDYHSWSHTLSLDLSWPIVRSRNLNLSAIFSFENRNSYSDLLSARYTTDRLRCLPFGLNFDFSDRFGGVTQINSSLSRGLKIFNATDQAWDASNPLAPAQYIKFSLYVSRYQRLFGQFSLFAALSFQFSNSILNSYNQFSLGGSTFGRGFESGVIQNDSGLALSLEPRWTHWLTDKTAVQICLFYDWGLAWPAKQAIGAPDLEQLSSFGLGLRLWGHVGADKLPDFNLSLFVAKGWIPGQQDQIRWGAQFTLFY